MSFCSKCGEALVMGWAYCQGCGAPTPAAVPSSPVAAQASSDTTSSDAAGAELAPIPSERSAPFSPARGADPAVGDDEASTLDHPVADDTAETSVLQEPAEAVIDAVPGKRRRRRRVVLIALGAACALAALVVTTLHILGTHDRLDRARTDLASTQATLEDTRADLSTTKRELSDTTTELATRTDERDALQGELEITKSNLSDARGKVDLQASVIEDLRYCLDGVADAMVHLAGGYWYSAIDALDRVESACERASNSVV